MGVETWGVQRGRSHGGERGGERRHWRTEPPGEGRAWTLPSQPVLLTHHFLTWPSVSSSPYKLSITRGCILLQGPCRELSSGQGPASGGLSAWKASLAILHLAIQSYCFFKAHLTHYILPFLQGEVSIPLIFLPRVLLGAFISITCFTHHCILRLEHNVWLIVGM